MAENVQSDVPPRGKWARKAEFLLSCIGYAIGIGNVWRFPYLCYRSGGGAFLIPYLLMLILCGIPLFLMETSLGQFSSTGCLTLFEICPLMKGAGMAIIIVNLIGTSYYNVILSYTLYFIVMTFSKKLPWSDCGNPWNTPKCQKLDILETNIVANISKEIKTPADEFFHKKILEISDGIDNQGSLVIPLVILNIISWIIIFICIAQGVKSVGKVVYFTATFPFVILLILFIRGVTLPGAFTGIHFYIYPRWEYLTNFKVWADAAIQIFFSLGPGWGGIVTMASYNNFNNNIKRDSLLVPIINCGTSIFAGFVVFSVLGFMSNQTGIPVSHVVTGGPGLAFVTYPEALTLMPFPHFWSILFFFMLYLLGMDSCFVQIEAIISSVSDEYPHLHRHKLLIAFSSCFIMFLCSLLYLTNGGMYLLQLFDWYACSISVILICFVEVIIITQFYGTEAFVRDIEFMINDKINILSIFCWKYITPSILLIIFFMTIAFNTEITYNNVIYPYWSHVLGWFSAASSMICIPIYMIYKLAITPGTLKQRFKSTLSSTSKWGPSNEEDRKAWMNLKCGNEMKEIH